MRVRTSFSLAMISLMSLSVATAAAPYRTATNVNPRFLVQAATTAIAHQDVDQVGASVEQDLGIIHAVAARLDRRQAAKLRATQGLRIFEDRSVATESLSGLLGGATSVVSNTVSATLVTASKVPVVSSVTKSVVSGVSSSTATKDGTGVNTPALLYQTNYPMLVGADTLQQSGITGRGVTIAVLDTGLWQDVSQNYGSRLLATVDVTNGGSGPVTGDPYGHGTHITSIAAGGAVNVSGGYFGIAPQANLVILRAFDGEGGGRY